jgi:glutathione S-transferase
MKLYTFDPAPNPKRLQLFMAYKGIELDTQQIDMMVAEHLSDKYTAINPVRTLPTLVLDDGNIMTEVVGICLYLESLYPQKPLMGTSDYEKAEVISWDHKLHFSGLMAVAEIFRNGNPAFKNRALPGPLDIPQIPELVTRGQLRLAGFFTDMDAHLTGRDYIVGNSLTLADVDCYAIVGFAGWVKAAIPDNCPNMQAWYDRVKSDLNQ